MNLKTNRLIEENLPISAYSFDTATKDGIIFGYTAALSIYFCRITFFGNWSRLRNVMQALQHGAYFLVGGDTGRDER